MLNKIAGFKGRRLQQDYFVKTEKVNGTGLETGYDSWCYRLKCKHCGKYSETKSGQQKGIPLKIRLWSVAHNCKEKRAAQKTRPG